MPIKVYRTGPNLYVGIPGFRPGLDKWWRVYIPATGPVDTYGERLLPSATILNTFSKNYAAGLILTNGGEESPVLKLPIGFVGGNHLIPGATQKSIFNWQVQVTLDAKALPANGWFTGTTLTIVERYRVRKVVNGPAICEIIITRTFNAQQTMNFMYKVKVLSAFDLNWFSGLQSQKPNLKPGETITLLIPGTVAPTGTVGQDVTNLAVETHFPVNTWKSPNYPPSRYERIVKKAGAPQFTVLQGFTGSPYRGSISDAGFWSAAKKFYPIGVMFDPARTMQPGEEFHTAGYSGSYNSH